MSSNEKDLYGGDPTPDETLHLIEEQNKIKEKLKVLTGPDSLKPITREQKIKRVADLESLLYDFVLNHESIIKNGKPDIPYIVNKSGEKTMQLVKQMISDIQSLELPAPRKATPRTPDVTVPVGSEQSQQTLRLRKLELKIANLLHAIEEIGKEIVVYVTSGMRFRSWKKTLFLMVAMNHTTIPFVAMHFQQ